MSSDDWGHSVWPGGGPVCGQARMSLASGTPSLASSCIPERGPTHGCDLGGPGGRQSPSPPCLVPRVGGSPRLPLAMALTVRLPCRGTLPGSTKRKLCGAGGPWTPLRGPTGG